MQIDIPDDVKSLATALRQAFGDGVKLRHVATPDGELGKEPAPEVDMRCLMLCRICGERYSESMDSHACNQVAT